MTTSGEIGSKGAGTRVDVLQALGRSGPVSAAELARQTGLSPSTISKILAGLDGAGLIRKDPQPIVRAGRRPSILSLSPRVGLAIGIDIGHRHIRVAVADSTGEILAQAYDRGPDIERVRVPRTLEVAVDLAVHALGSLDFNPSLIRGVAMGVPAPVDHQAGTIASPWILPQWHGLPIAKMVEDLFESRLGCRVRVILDNDANLCVLGEVSRGVGQGKAQVVFIKASAGIGAGLFLDGKLYRGSLGAAGEFGHTPLPDLESKRGGHARLGSSLPSTQVECGTCGQLGCLETIASGRAIVTRLIQAKPQSYGPPLSSSDVVRQALKHVDMAIEGEHPESHKEIRISGLYLGAALAGLINLLDPELIIVGGTLARAGDLYLDAIRSEVVRRTVCRRPGSIVVESSLRELAELRGAIQTVLAHTYPLEV